MRFQPSFISAHNNPDDEPKAGKAAAKVAGSAALTIGKNAISSAVGGGAGIAAGLAAVPVAGWVALGVVGATAATIGIVKAVRKGKMRLAELVKIAEQSGIPDAAELPKFTVRAVKASPEKRAALAQKFEKAITKLEAKAGKKKRQRRVDALSKKIDLMISRLAILAVAENLAVAEQMGKEAPADLTTASNLYDDGGGLTTAEQEAESESMLLSPPVLAAAGAGVLVLGTLIYLAVRKK